MYGGYILFLVLWKFAPFIVLQLCEQCLVKHATTKIRVRSQVMI